MYDHQDNRHFVTKDLERLENYYLFLQDYENKVLKHIRETLGFFSMWYAKYQMSIKHRHGYLVFLFLSPLSKIKETNSEYINLFRAIWWEKSRVSDYIWENQLELPENLRLDSSRKFAFIGSVDFTKLYYDWPYCNKPKGLK
jgi:hypothetical protein